MTLGRNAERERERHARNFGAEADAVRGMPCLVAIVDNRTPCSGQEIVYGDEIELGSEPAHIISRGASGGRFDIIPLCAHHHAEQHQHGVKTFAAKYGLDLRAEADLVALEHERPLGIRGLADRWAWWQRSDELVYGEARPEPLDAYETDALRGWLSRRFIAIAHGHGRLLPGVGWQHIEHAAPGLALDLAAAIEGDLDISEAAAAALCEWAWGPS